MLIVTHNNNIKIIKYLISEYFISKTFFIKQVKVIINTAKNLQNLYALRHIQAYNSITNLI